MVPHFLRILFAIPLGHHHIGDEQMDFPGVLLGQLNRHHRRIGGKHCVPQALEDGLAEIQDRGSSSTSSTVSVPSAGSSARLVSAVTVSLAKLGR